MIYSSVLLAVTAFTATVSAQNYSTSGNLSIDASQITPVVRQSWCQGQTNSCPYLCDGATAQNDCDSTTLTYNCVCAGSSTPNISDYAQTMPTYICQQWVANCVDSHPNDLAGITGCRSVICGSKNATAYGANSSTGGSSSSSAAPSSTTVVTTTVATNAATTTSAAATRTGAAMAVGVAQSYGTAVLSAAILGFFGLAL